MSYKVITLEGFFSAMLSTEIALKSESLNILETSACILLSKDAFGQIFKSVLKAALWTCYR